MTTSTQRKLLFVLFSDDACRLNHALLYAIDLHRKGTATVRVIVEGAATRVLGVDPLQGTRTTQLLGEAMELGLVAGACRTASGGCSSDDPERQVLDAVQGLGVPLLDDLDGHAGVEPFIREGYELVPF